MADSKKEQYILKENLVGVYPTPFDLHFSVAHIKWYSDNPEDYISNLIGTCTDVIFWNGGQRRYTRSL